MEQNIKLISVLNDLILINTERVIELKKRIKSVGRNSGLASLFSKMMKESNQFKGQLIEEVEKKNGKVLKKVIGNTTKLSDLWRELKSWMVEKKELSELEMEQFYMKAILKVYEEALFVVPNISADTLDLIATQKASLRKSCKAIEAILTGEDHSHNFQN